MLRAGREDTDYESGFTRLQGLKGLGGGFPRGSFRGAGGWGGPQGWEADTNEVKSCQRRKRWGMKTVAAPPAAQGTQ